MKTHNNQKQKNTVHPHKRYLTVLTLLAVFLTVTLFLGYIVFPPQKLPKGRQTVFLNPSALPSVSKVCVSFRGSVLTLQKTGEGWTGLFAASQDTSADIQFPVDSRIMADFFAALVAPRLVYTVATGISLWKSTGIDDEQAISLTLSGSDGQPVAGFFFGNMHYSGNSIYFRDDRTLHSYYTKNDILPFLTTRAESWADMLLFAQSPKSFGIEDLVRIVRTASQTEVFHNAIGEQGIAFETVARILLGSRGSSLLPRQTVSGLDIAAELRLHLTDGSQKSITVYKSQDSYIVAPDTFEYCLEISGWTFERISGMQKTLNFDES